MDDIQIVLYILFLVIALISRVMKSRKQEAPKTASKSSPTQNKPAKSLTFEELLREFTEQPQPEAKKAAQEVEVVDYEDFDYKDETEIQRIYEDSIKASKQFEQSTHSEDDRHTGNFRHFEGYSEKDVEEEESEYALLLQDEESAKRAIILSEIINRKY